MTSSFLGSLLKDAHEGDSVYHDPRSEFTGLIRHCC